MRGWKVSSELGAIQEEFDIQQYLYSMPPFRRAYIFDKEEALVSFYEIRPDTLDDERSIYCGMTNPHGLHIKGDSPLGKHLLQELQSYICRLKETSHSWAEEIQTIQGGIKPRWLVKRPCINPKLALLDLDGVLYDSLPFWEKAWQSVSDELGVVYPENFAYLHEGRNTEDTVRTLLKISKRKININLAIRKAKKILETALDSQNSLPIQPGAIELVKAIKKAGLDIWIVTGSTDPRTRERISNDFEDIIPTAQIITGESFARGKPNPEPYTIACAKAQCESHRALCIENSPLGIQSASEADLLCIAVNTGVLTDKELYESGAKAVFPSCGELAKSWKKLISVVSVPRKYVDRS